LDWIGSDRIGLDWIRANGLKIVIAARDYKTETNTKTGTELIIVKINYHSN